MREIKYRVKILNSLIFSLYLFLGIILTGCGSSGNNSNRGVSIIKNSGFSLEYNGTTALEEVPLTTEDLDEIVALYQEFGSGSDYKDSLMVAEKYSGGLGINTFVQENLNTLEDQGLVLDNIKKSQISIVKNGEKINGVLVEYEITEGLIKRIPRLYISQLFVNQDENVILFSYITESRKSHGYSLNMLKNIK